MDTPSSGKGVTIVEACGIKLEKRLALLELICPNFVKLAFIMGQVFGTNRERPKLETIPVVLDKPKIMKNILN